jgi:hypothetical protein
LVALDVVVEIGKYLRVQLGHEPQYARLDLVHVELLREFHQIALGSALLESIEGALDHGAVIGSGFIFFDGDPVALDQQGIFDGRQIGFELVGFGNQGGESVRAGVVDQIATEGC